MEKATEPEPERHQREPLETLCLNRLQEEERMEKATEPEPERHQREPLQTKKR